MHRPGDLDGEPSVAAIGVFDGVHLGHQRVIGRAVESAARCGWRSLVVTFDPLPETVLAPGRGVEPITSCDQKLALISHLGVAATLLLPFTRELAALGAEDFVREYLVPSGVREVYVGFDLRLGRNREADWEALAALAARAGVRVRPVEPVLHGEEKISSTRIREILRRGDVRLAAEMLGRYHAVCGKVVRGAGEGRRLGVRTANIARPEGMLPAGGVYACWAHVLDRRWMAAVSVGHPAVFRRERAGALVPPAPVEAALVGLEADLYGEAMEIRFVRRLRDVEPLESAEELAARIRNDILAAQEALEEDRSPLSLQRSRRP